MPHEALVFFFCLMCLNTQVHFQSPGRTAKSCQKKNNKAEIYCDYVKIKCLCNEMDDARTEI